MSILRHRETASPSISFPISRTGYDRSSVDQFTQMVRTRLESVLSENDTLTSANQRLNVRVVEREAAPRQTVFDPVGGQRLVQAESARLLASAQWQADAIRTDAEQSAQMVVESARLQGAALLGAAEKECAAARHELAADRQRCADELFTAHQDATTAAEALLTEAAAQQVLTAQHLNQEATEAARLREELLVWAQGVEDQAVFEAAALVSQAQHDAAVIEERVRQEAVWRGRHIREEQALVTQRKLELLQQLSSLRALAAGGTEAMTSLAKPALSEVGPNDETAAQPAEGVLAGG